MVKIFQCVPVSARAYPEYSEESLQGFSRGVTIIFVF